MSTTESSGMSARTREHLARLRDYWQENAAPWAAEQIDEIDKVIAHGSLLKGERLEEYLTRLNGPEAATSRATSLGTSPGSAAAAPTSRSRRRSSSAWA